MTATITPLRPAAPLALLVVDDDAVMRCVLCDGLRCAGYKVFEASSGADALTIMGEMPVHLVLLDPSLEGAVDGRIVARAAALRPAPKVILASSTGDPSRTTDVPGGDLVVAKPYAVPRILELVRQVFDAQGPRS